MTTEVPTRQFRYRVLVLFPSVENRMQLLRAVTVAGMIPRLSDSFEEGKRALEAGDVDIVICEERVSKETIEETLKYTRKRAKSISVIVTSRTGEWGGVFERLEAGRLRLPPPATAT